MTGNTDIESEKLMAYELGYRRRVTDRMTLDATVFYNDYADLQTFSSLTYGAVDNLADAESYGAETVVTWQVAENWRLSANHSYIHITVDPDTVSANSAVAHNRVSLQSYLDITDNLELNVAGYYSESRVPPASSRTDFFRLDVGLTWRPTEHLELALVGQNLLDSAHHEEFISMIQVDRSEVPRAVYGQVTFRF
jgi:iron complex outermembrane recepter protein